MASSAPDRSSSTTTASYLSYPVSHVASALYRRITEPHSSSSSSPGMHKRSQSSHNTPMSLSTTSANNNSILYQPPARTASPFAPPPLTGLSLRGHRNPKYQLLTRTLAEEIRLLLPPRLQLATEWMLAYGIEQDGVSLATLYEKCERFAGRGHGYVLVVRDSAGGTFGAYLTDPPHPSPHYFGTGECFLWRATVLPASAILSSLPPPPSADTSNLTRSTTLSAGTPGAYSHTDLLSPWSPPARSPSPSPSFPSHPNHTNNHTQNGNGYTHRPRRSSSHAHLPSPSPTSNSNSTTSPFSPPLNTNPFSPSNPLADVPERIRFKAFPYSGLNDYMMFCEQGYLSVGGGDGRYGLWLDSVLERGVSQGCPTFGNECLSEEGEKFEVLGVEVWWVGS